MPHRYPSEIRRQVVELARSGTRVAQLSATFGMTETTIYNWIKQDRIDNPPKHSAETAMPCASPFVWEKHSRDVAGCGR
jgi:transposase-like protein